ncbi:Ig-like domain-containing protein [Brevibacillus agri]|uniref:Ig-like domain-containing protein n=1 Tax=Brevibacillus agri TaxID=51101 RepID=UPI003D1B5802
MANGDLIKLGTFYLAGAKKVRPTKPWRSDTTPPGAPSVGDIPSFSAGQTIEIRDTDASDAYKIQWREVKGGAKKLLIADRDLLVNVSWDDLNAQGLIFGKTITIDGQQYKLRVLTGGSNYRGADGYSGGTPTDNEWDRIIVNEAGLNGLPTPTASDLDNSANSTDFNSAHNQFWNWYYMYSWAQETYTGNSAGRAIRGYLSARGWDYYGAAARFGVGWRPVLEVLNSVPSVTLTNPANNQTLAEGNTLPVEGAATDSDSGNVLTVKYKINNGPTRALQSGVSDGSKPISFARTLTYSGKRMYDGATDVVGVDLAENTDHTLTVWAEDDKGGKSAEVTRKFRVIWNRPPTISGENGDLGIMEEPPSVEYTVTEPETNPFTVTEKINGQVIRTFAGVAGRQETITIPHELWLRLEPGVQHALTIETSDDQGMTSTRTYTLTRFVDKIVFSLDFATMQQETKDFFTTDVAAKRLLLTPIWDLPPGAILLVEVCNNAYDEEPSWEDATIVVKLNRAHLFANETKTAAEWGINFRFQIEKGSATQPIYLKGVGGAFD